MPQVLQTVLSCRYFEQHNTAWASHVSGGISGSLVLPQNPTGRQAHLDRSLAQEILVSQRPAGGVDRLSLTLRITRTNDVIEGRERRRVGSVLRKDDVSEKKKLFGSQVET